MDGEIKAGQVVCNRSDECPADCPCKKPHTPSMRCLAAPGMFFEPGAPDHHRCNFSDCDTPATNFWKD